MRPPKPSAEAPLSYFRVFAVFVSIVSAVSCSSDSPHDSPAPQIALPEGPPPSPTSTVPTQTPGPSPEETPGEPEVLRFVALGDTGKATDGQFAVADAIREKCAGRMRFRRSPR